MKRMNLFALALALLLLLTACGGNGAAQDSAAAEMPSADMEFSGMTTTESKPMDNGFPGSASPMEPETQWKEDAGTGSSVYQDSNAKLIRRAELTIQTTEFDQAVNALNQLVEQLGGYYENASLYAGSYRNAHANRSGEYIVRIPAEKYVDFRSSTGELGYVSRIHESSENVGEQYHDAETRLKTQRTKQERLLGLLEQAATMEDIIDLENALSEVEYEIEQLTSTLNRYDALIGFSTFTIFLEEVTKVTQDVGETNTLTQRMAAGFASSVDDLVDGTQDLLVWLSYNVFGLAVLAAVVLVAVVVVRRGVKKALKLRRGPDHPAE